jgi:hypothetical protein
MYNIDPRVEKEHAPTPRARPRPKGKSRTTPRGSALRVAAVAGTVKVKAFQLAAVTLSQDLPIAAGIRRKRTTDVVVAAAA